MNEVLTIKNTNLSFIIPTLNEEEGISDTIKSIPMKRLTQMGYNPKVFVVDGGSTDRTIECARYMHATIIKSPKKGYGYQFKYAFSKIESGIIITGDGDGTYPFDVSPKLLEILRKGDLDFITTNRMHDLKKNSMSKSRYIGNQILTTLTNLFFGLSLKDSQSGMWCFRKDSITHLNLVSNNFSFSEEIKIKAMLNLKCDEIDIKYSERSGKSKLNLMDGIETVISCLS